MGELDPNETVLLRDLPIGLGRLRRASVRFIAPPGSRAVLDTDGEVTSAHVVNLSVGGTGLLVGQPMAEGSILQLSFGGGVADGWPDGPAEVRGRVVHCSTQAAGDWYVGCEFDQPLSTPEVKQLLARLFDETPA